MPSLIHVGEFRGSEPKRDPRFYFKNAQPNMYGGWKFTIEDDYPYAAHIHQDVISELAYGYNHTFFVELRRFVERRCEGDVLYEYLNMGYRWWWNKEAVNDWDKKFSDIRHGYWHFYFESKNDSSMFALTHAEKLSTVQKYHPDYGQDILEQDKTYGKVT